MGGAWSGAGLIFCALACAGTSAVQPQSNCLYSATVGASKRVVVPCGDEDPQNLGKNKDIQGALRAFGIDPRSIRFRACDDGRFSASPDARPPFRYVISYPRRLTAVPIAPIVHELAHAFQMEHAGGLESLRTRPSLQVELAADFLTGLVLSRHLKHVSVMEFQANLALIGLFEELPITAHGTPAQRVAAFRRGVNYELNLPTIDFRTAHEDFYADEFSRIVQ